MIVLNLKRTLILALLAIGPSAAADTVVRFHFVTDERGGFVEGDGAFSFADGLTTVGLGDVTGFAFEASVVDVIHGGPQYYNYDSTMLKTLAATFEAGSTGPTLTSLSLSTSPRLPLGDPLFPELAFNITSIAKDGAFMETWKSGVDEGVYSVGTTSIIQINTGAAPIPEPSSAVTLGLGAMGVGLAWRRRRKARATARNVAPPR